ncbi:MAG: lytic transglycosylase domain-containing protein [Myxococcales bacterium]|nr:lytic transglycosylase domain-containing protein [Myxococcales bacterium]
MPEAEAEPAVDVASSSVDPSTGEPWASSPELGPLEPAPTGDPEPVEAVDLDGPLEGRSGAATALIARDPATALALLDAEPPAAEGSREWFSRGALRARVLRMQGRAGEAVSLLEPRLAHAELEDAFPKDVLGFELARARVEWARSGGLETEAADAQLETASRELSKLRKHASLRNLAELRVLQAEALAGVAGGSDKASKRAGQQAAKALAKIVADYPNHPRIGDLRLAHAEALRRAGKDAEAATALRRIVIERAGEPEEAEAWAELQELAAANPKVGTPSLSFAERLEQAMLARGLRRVERSREVLDELLADPELSSSQRRQVHRSRSYTAYKQRDYQACVDDLRPLYDEGIGGEVRDWLLRCYERGEMYDEALAIWQHRIDSTNKVTRSGGLWSGIELAVRAGRYVQAEAWLNDYEKSFKGHVGERRWLRAWLPYRLGRDPEAIAGFREVVKRGGSEGRTAEYFLGKLLARSDDPAERTEGIGVLQQIAAGDAWSYYGLMARQRLLDVAAETPPLPELPAVADEARRPSRVDTERRLAELDARFGEAWPTLRRTRQLYEAGYLEEARRELRHATKAYIGTKQGYGPGPRSEALIVGLGWKAEWDFPRAKPTRAGRKTMRIAEEDEALSRGLRALAHDLSEPHEWAKLSTSADGPYKARWHPRAYRASLEREARLRKVDPIHLWSLMYTESRYRRHVVSPVGARGALQIMPWTGRQLAERLGELPADGRFDSDTLFDIDTNAHLASYYISELLFKFHGQGPMAYASYNGGPSNVGRWLRAKSKEGAPLELDAFVEEIDFDESRRYAKRVTEVSAAYAMLYEGRLPRWTNEVDPVVEDNIDF